MKTLKNTLLALISVLMLSACTSITENTPDETGVEASVESTQVSTSETENTPNVAENIPNETEEEISVESTEVSTDNMTAEEEYQFILNNYTEKLKNATPTLIDEYIAEAASNTNGLTGLAEIANSKVSDLAAITTEGTQEMAKVMFKKGTGSYSEYESWGLKLYDVYMSEAQKITDAYMNSAK